MQPKFTSDDNGVQTVQGYTYVNSLSIDIDNLTNDLLAQVLDTAVQTGGNAVSIDSVTFELSPLLADNLTIQAEASAVSDARNQAARYAKVILSAHFKKYFRRFFLQSQNKYCLQASVSKLVSSLRLLFCSVSAMKACMPPPSHTFAQYHFSQSRNHTNLLMLKAFWSVLQHFTETSASTTWLVMKKCPPFWPAEFWNYSWACPDSHNLS